MNTYLQFLLISQTLLEKGLLIEMTNNNNANTNNKCDNNNKHKKKTVVFKL